MDIFFAAFIIFYIFDTILSIGWSMEQTNDPWSYLRGSQPPWAERANICYIIAGGMMIGYYLFK